MECITCGYISCFSCSSPWHEGKTCLQAHNLLAQDPKSDQYKRKYCKKCPGAGCGIFTGKDGACHEMECPNSRSLHITAAVVVIVPLLTRQIESCGVTWCWECKLIMDTSVDYTYETRALEQHTRACRAPAVCSKKGMPGYRSVPKPAVGGKYRAGWDRDDGFIGTGYEYD